MEKTANIKYLIDTTCYISKANISWNTLFNSQTIFNILPHIYKQFYGTSLSRWIIWWTRFCWQEKNIFEIKNIILTNSNKTMFAVLSDIDNLSFCIRYRNTNFLWTLEEVKSWFMTMCRNKFSSVSRIRLHGKLFIDQHVRTSKARYTTWISRI